MSIGVHGYMGKGIGLESRIGLLFVDACKDQIESSQRLKRDFQSRLETFMRFTKSRHWIVFYVGCSKVVLVTVLTQGAAANRPNSRHPLKLALVTTRFPLR